MKAAIDSKKWDSFHQKYCRIADYIINQARERKMLDVTIEWKSKFYPNFEEIENATLTCHPYRSRNVGEMLVIRPGPLLYRNSSPNSPAESTGSKKDNFYREARDKYSPRYDYSSGILLRAKPYVNGNGVSSHQSRIVSTAEKLILDATALLESIKTDSQTVYMPAATNESCNAKAGQTPGRVSTTSHGETRNDSKIADNGTFIDSFSRTAGVSLEQETMVLQQIANNQPISVLIAATAAPCDNHQEIYGGYSLQPQSVVPNNQILSSENPQSSYQGPQPSESLEKSYPEPIINPLGGENRETPESTTLQQDFSTANDSVDVENLKQHDDSFEELTVKPDNQTDEDLNKQSPEDHEFAVDYRSSLGSINFDFSPLNDSSISFQSCFDLDDLRRTNDSPVESIDAKFDDELFKHQIEMSQVDQDVGRTEHLIAEELNAMQNQETIIRDNPELAEEEEDSLDFNRQFEEMKRQQAEELRRIREEHRRKQQKLNDELQRRTNEIPGESIDAKFDGEYGKHQLETDQMLNKMNVSEVETTEQLTNENILVLELASEDRLTTSVDQVSTTKADGHRDEDAIRKHLKEKERKRQMARRKRNTNH
ncbi:unnamed protein product [Caenorhabditis brenneri]